MVDLLIDLRKENNLNIDFSPLFDFFDYVSSFFNAIWEFLLHSFQAIGEFFKILLSSLSVADFFSLGFFPAILQGFAGFVCAVALIKLVVTLGGYTE